MLAYSTKLLTTAKKSSLPNGGKPLTRIIPIDPPQKGNRIMGDCSQTAAIHVDIVNDDASSEWEALDS